MKSFYILFFFSISLCNAQKNAREIVSPTASDCKRTSDLNFIQLADKFPINNSDKIAIVAFNSKGGPQGLHMPSGTQPEVIPQYGFPLPSDSLEFQLLKEWKFLNFKEVAQLADILYNYNFTNKKSARIYGYSCYAPRNGIVFINKNNKIIEFLEICFECTGFETMKKTHSFGDFCAGKLDMLYHFFLENGIKFGITDQIK